LKFSAIIVEFGGCSGLPQALGSIGTQQKSKENYKDVKFSCADILCTVV